MNIGIRITEMPMKLNQWVRIVVSFFFLASQTNAFADFLVDEPAIKLVQDSLRMSLPAKEDTISCHVEKDNRYQFNAEQLILPGALIAVGTFGVYNGEFKKLNVDIRDGMNKIRGNCYIHVDDYVQYLPALSYLTLGSIGIKSKHSFKERLVVGCTAYISMTALCNIGKYSFRERRPDSNTRNSFPSGHTATVFTGAELMREEYGLSWGIGAYSVAVGVAFLRIYNGRHWLNDVIAGAGLGILSARIGYWMLPLYQKLFHWDNNSSKAIVIYPSYNAFDKSIAIGCVCVL